MGCCPGAKRERCGVPCGRAWPVVPGAFSGPFWSLVFWVLGRFVPLSSSSLPVVTLCGGLHVCMSACSSVCRACWEQDLAGTAHYDVMRELLATKEAKVMLAIDEYNELFQMSHWHYGDDKASAFFFLVGKMLLFFVGKT